MCCVLPMSLQATSAPKPVCDMLCCPTRPDKHLLQEETVSMSTNKLPSQPAGTLDGNDVGRRWSLLSTAPKRPVPKHRSP